MYCFFFSNQHFSWFSPVASQLQVHLQTLPVNSPLTLLWNLQARCSHPPRLGSQTHLSGRVRSSSPLGWAQTWTSMLCLDPDITPLTRPSPQEAWAYCLYAQLCVQARTRNHLLHDTTPSTCKVRRTLSQGPTAELISLWTLFAASLSWSQLFTHLCGLLVPQIWPDLSPSSSKPECWSRIHYLQAQQKYGLPRLCPFPSIAAQQGAIIPYQGETNFQPPSGAAWRITSILSNKTQWTNWGTLIEWSLFFM